ncbi:MAG: hypothetical protein H7177_02590, partial [Rhizobacter sp.]|nr:hypothetical protein [Bacteriovorax sp.]
VLKGYLAFSKKNSKSLEAMEKFDRGFEIIKKNGELKKLQLLWRKLAIEKS